MTGGSLRESGHVIVHRVFGDEIAGVTIVATAECSGRTWGPQGVALVEQHKNVVRAIAQALIDHPKRTLDGAEIDAVIVPALAAKAAADERKRRADWCRVEQNAADFAAGA